MAKLAVIILTKNEEANIAEAIKSASFADEIIIIDSGSTDKTVEIAQEHGGKIVIHPMDESGFAGQRNFALTQTEADWVFYLDADFNVVMKRFTGIRSCPNCGKVYNSLIKEFMPKKENICDDCGSSLIIRDDDNEETFMKRYEIYSNETEPLVSYYKDKNVLHHINGNLTQESIHMKIINVLEGESNG